jgi:phosphoadenosine phosphosulfate reductase
MSDVTLGITNASHTNLDTKITALETALTQIATVPSVALASSLSMEDQIIVDVIARLCLKIESFTLNTGRLHRETLAVVAATSARYDYTIALVDPVKTSVVHYVKSFGDNAFYDSVDLRKACCNIRKIEPLRRALAGRGGWITGQRREQSITRTALASEEFDAAHQMRKFNPLADWTAQDVQNYVRRYAVPVNALHARGYPSIGCEPCTRAVKPGEDDRAGRWWWENANSKECGLHIKTA